ncbi:MAG TPA: class I tRNA ligase family protein [Gemmataceae bacterium]|nr:class I tRNA ligase family protein [Gemmataceae bacterium]
MNRPKAPGYPFEAVERNYQMRWEVEGMFRADRDDRKQKWFIVELPPFANGRLHLGHVRNYVIADVDARFRRMAGFNVLYTTGFDSFGLPNELASREEGVHPRDLAERCMASMRADFVRLGLGHDTRRICGYHEPPFYRWVQWVFNELVRAGHAFRQQSRVNWCPTCELSLADSLVENGRCWRCRQAVVSRLTKQWFVDETVFADSMLDGTAGLEGWPDSVKTVQADWIGRREGIEVQFTIAGRADLSVAVFLEEPALLPAITFVSVSLQHPILAELRTAGLLTTVEMSGLDAFDERTLATRESRKQSLSQSEAFQLTAKVVNPLTHEAIPLVVLDLIESADGVMAGCSGHNRVARRVAAALNLPSTTILKSPSHLRSEDPADYGADWVMQAPWEGKTLDEGRREILHALLAIGQGKPSVRYRLRHWNIARQRYWGTPVPVVHCPACGAVPVPDAELPVVLPLNVELGDANNPLELHEDFVRASCPKCGALARRDTDTLEAYSSPWWFLWHCRDLDNDLPFHPPSVDYWMPVDFMVGGIDQARSCFFHARMMARALTALGHLAHDEPIDYLLAIGMVKQSGQKMSKSARNQVNPDQLIAAYGADALRFGVMAAAAPENDLNWSDRCVQRASAFLNEVWNFFHARQETLSANTSGLPEANLRTAAASRRRKLQSWLDTAVERITLNYARHEPHLAAKNVMYLFERLTQFDREARAPEGALAPHDLVALGGAAKALLKLMTPLVPHIVEELWRLCGERDLINRARWPGPVPDGKPTSEYVP